MRRQLPRGPTMREARLKSQLAALKAEGGGDEPESLMDALYKVASMPATPKGSQTEDPQKWRYRIDAARVVIDFTDASFKETMSIAEAKGGALQDVANVIMANRTILSLFAPNFEGYDRLSQIDKSEWEVVEFDGLSPQQALQKFTSGEFSHHAEATGRQRIPLERDGSALQDPDRGMNLVERP